MTETVPPVAVAVAPNGGRRTRADHPALPLTAAELARTAAECHAAGAAMIHVHVRDPQGRHLLDADAYRAATAAIRAEARDEMVVQITSESLGRYSPAEQAAVVRATRPEAVSLALRELAPAEADERGFADLLDWCRREGVAPQVILYAPDEARRLDALRARGLVPDGIAVLYVLGRYAAGQRSDPADLLDFLVPGQPRFRHWSLCAFGARETACVTAGALLGGHVRVGFENNLWLPDGQRAAGNADLVRSAAAALAATGLRLASAGDLRAATAL